MTKIRYGSCSCVSRVLHQLLTLSPATGKNKASVNFKEKMVFAAQLDMSLVEKTAAGCEPQVHAGMTRASNR